MKKERVRAIIIKQDSILLIKRIFPDRTYWVFPGGGVDEGERKEAALVRECKEELGIDIEIQSLFTQEPSGKAETLNEMEYFYLVDIIGGVLGDAHGPEHKHITPERGEYRLVWENLDQLHEIDVRPRSVADRVQELQP